MSSETISIALDIANKHHRGQSRKGSLLPYLVHPLDVLRKLYDWGLHPGHKYVAECAILHDVYEDAECRLTAIDDVCSNLVDKY